MSGISYSRARDNAPAASADCRVDAASCALKPNPMFRLMPSLTDVAFLIPVLLLFSRMGGVRMLLSDGDTGWHIRTGEWILAHGRVPNQDLFSFTRPGQPWFAWEWLWDVCFAWLHGHGGLAAVALASLFVICLTFALLYRLVSRRCGNPLVAIGLTVIAAAGATLHWLARPHLFTMLFTVLFLAVLERARVSGRARLLWWLPALTAVWANVHGGFLVGIVILGACAAGKLAEALVSADREERVSAARASLPYLAAAAGCLAASLANPYSYHLHAHIWEFLRNPFATRYVSEFQAANFQTPASAFFEAMLLLGGGAAIWHGLHRRFTEVFLLVLWAHAGLLVARNIPLYMIVAAPAVAPAVVEWLRALGEAPVAAWLRKAASQVHSVAEIAPLDRLWRIHAVSAAALVVVAVGMASPSAGRSLRPEYDPKSFPAGALAVVNPSQRIFAADQWGDYLIYRLWPEGARVFFDSRFDFYDQKFGQEYIDVLTVKYDWEQTLSRYRVNTLLLPPDAPLASTAKESSHWRAVYDDGTAIVFRPANDAAGRGEPSSTGSIGGVRDLSITQSQDVIYKDHVSESKGASPL